MFSISSLNILVETSRSRFDARPITPIIIMLIRLIYNHLSTSLYGFARSMIDVRIRAHCRSIDSIQNYMLLSSVTQVRLLLNWRHVITPISSEEAECHSRQRLIWQLNVFFLLPCLKMELQSCRVASFFLSGDSSL